MTMPKAAVSAAVLADSAIEHAHEPVLAESPSGWDAYEVWRTRVLLPRLEEQAGAARGGTTTVMPFLIRTGSKPR
jgi:hypothetical protein